MALRKAVLGLPASGEVDRDSHHLTGGEDANSSVQVLGSLWSGFVFVAGRSDTFLRGSLLRAE
jgi:hypothetical protein